MSYDFIYKYIVIGDSGVGKSCLLIQFLENIFKDTHEPTIGVEFGAKIVDMGDTKVKLQVWDTAGQETFKSITRSYFRSAAGGLLVYDITDRKSFEDAAVWLEEARNNGNDNLVLCLVGNKLDLESE